MPSLDGVNATPELTDIQVNYDDLIPIYDLSERTPKATTVRNLLKSLGYNGVAVVDALRLYKSTNPASGEPPIDDQYFTSTDGTETGYTLSYNSNCWAARFDLTGTAWHAHADHGGGSRRAHLIGPRAVLFAKHYEPTGPMTFTNLQGQRFTYSLNTGTTTAGGVTYQSTMDLGDDGKIGILNTSGSDVDPSLRRYEIATSVETDEYVLATRSRKSSTDKTPYRQRIHFNQVYASPSSNQGFLSVKPSTFSGVSSSPFYSYMDDFGVHDSGDAAFVVGDDNTPKILTTFHEILGSGLLKGPFYGKTARLADIDTFLAAWGTTRVS
tara:strand:- start:370 stop:1344 length:975 start_codon:yes stop_codon:yes gene_type:complete